MPVHRASVKLESRLIERAFCPPGSWWAGPDDEALEPGEPTERVYPWEVDQSDYSIFFDLWRATGCDVEAEMERARSFLTQSANNASSEPERVS